MFIVLNTVDGFKLRVNVNEIKGYFRGTNNTTHLVGFYYEVVETPEQIDKILNESYIFVKEFK